MLIILTYLRALALLIMIILLGSPAIVSAKVSGVCVDCHTMHNSQGGLSTAKQYSSAASNLVQNSTPNQCLLVSDCIGCHFSSSSATIISNTPIILNSQQPALPLAGGNFYWGLTDSQKGHNVYGINPQEPSPMNAPPGFRSSVTLAGGYGNGPAAWNSQLSCAGIYGCHGDRTKGSSPDQVLDSMKGAHHTDDSTIDGTSVGTSFRFLRGVTGQELNASGYKWEQNADSTHHNGYKGASSPGASTNTISYLCGSCHGNFHGANTLGGSYMVGSSNPWFRHPADISFSTAIGGYGSSEYAAYTTYSTTAPVALATPSTFTSTVDSTSMVMCLSCHRAHGSPNYKMLRWDYAGWPGNGQTNGCNVCHTSIN